MPSNVAVHTISFRGKAGAIFVTLCCAVVSFIVGYVTQSWSQHGDIREGLWETCNCSAIKYHDGIHGKYKHFKHRVRDLCECKASFIGIFIRMLKNMQKLKLFQRLQPMRD